MNKLWIAALVVTFFSPSLAIGHREQSNLGVKRSNRGAKFLFSSEYYCWTQWFNRDDPSATGDWETLPDLLKEYPGKVCPDPVDFEATTLSGTPANQTGDVFFKYDKTSGLFCRNEDQKGKMCNDYRVRFSCPSAYCSEKVCWTDWFDRDDPSGTGDWEDLSDLRKENPGKICETPQYIQAQTTAFFSTSAELTGQKFYMFNPTTGFVCRNNDQNSKECKDYEVRFGCC